MRSILMDALKTQISAKNKFDVKKINAIANVADKFNNSCRIQMNYNMAIKRFAINTIQDLEEIKNN